MAEKLQNIVLKSSAVSRVFLFHPFFIIEDFKKSDINLLKFFL